MATPARTKVLGTPELLASILYSGTVTDLMTWQLVSKDWQTAITSSPDYTIAICTEPLKHTTKILTKPGDWRKDNLYNVKLQIPVLYAPEKLLARKNKSNFTAQAFASAARACAKNGTYILNPIMKKLFGKVKIEDPACIAASEILWFKDRKFFRAVVEKESKHEIFENMYVTEPPMSRFLVRLALGPHVHTGGKEWHWMTPICAIPESWHWVIDQSACRGIKSMERCTKWGILENEDGVTVKQVLEFVREGLDDLKRLGGDWRMEVMLPSSMTEKPGELPKCLVKKKK